MPTYDYKCNSCSHTLEIFQSMTEKAKRKCPKCGKNTLERLIGTGAAVLFKGSGFYQTDYRPESYKKAAAAEQGSTSNDASSSSKASASGGEVSSEAKAKSEPVAKPAKEQAKPTKSNKSEKD